MLIRFNNKVAQYEKCLNNLNPSCYTNRPTSDGAMPPEHVMNTVCCLSESKTEKLLRETTVRFLYSDNIYQEDIDCIVSCTGSSSHIASGMDQMELAGPVIGKCVPEWPIFACNNVK